jgi:hypothetical protein
LSYRLLPHWSRPMTQMISLTKRPNQALLRTAPGRLPTPSGVALRAEGIRLLASRSARVACCSPLSPPRSSHGSTMDLPPLVPYAAAPAVPLQSSALAGLGSFGVDTRSL